MAHTLYPLVDEYKFVVILGVVLIVAGLALLALGLILPGLKAGGKVEGGAVIIIGPIPIVVASSPSTARILMILGIVLTLLALLTFLLPPLLLRR